MEEFNLFQGTDGYIASRALQDAVNVCIALERPLLLKGEPGTGKTMLARHIAEDLSKDLIVWNVKSTTKAKEGLYTYDTVQRLNDARFGEGDVRDIRNYIRMGPLGRAFGAGERVVLLIDEIDKADVEFPNDLLQELDEMSFRVIETDEVVAARERPIVIITSNSEKELPDAFLRRCVFHYIDFPEAGEMADIISVHFPNLPSEIMDGALEVFYGIREIRGLRKRPSTSELLDWIRVLLASGLKPNKGDKLSATPFMGSLIKMQEDAETIEMREGSPRSAASAGRNFFS